MKIDDANGHLIALTYCKAFKIVKSCMQNLQAVMKHIDPDWFKPCHSDKYGFAFDSIHFDTYNRYTEKVNLFH